MAFNCPVGAQISARMETYENAFKGERLLKECPAVVRVDIARMMSRFSNGMSRESKFNTENFDEAIQSLINRSVESLLACFHGSLLAHVTPKEVSLVLLDASPKDPNFSPYAGQCVELSSAVSSAFMQVFAREMIRDDFRDEFWDAIVLPVTAKAFSLPNEAEITAYLLHRMIFYHATKFPNAVIGANFKQSELKGKHHREQIQMLVDEFGGDWKDEYTLDEQLGRIYFKKPFIRKYHHESNVLSYQATKLIVEEAFDVN